MSPHAKASQLIEYIRERHPRSLTGVLEARSVSPGRFDEYADLYLTWAVGAFGPDIVQQMADAFVRFTMDVNFAQARYESVGHYENKSYEECEASVYSQADTMRQYLLGIYLTNFLWAHHMELSLFFEERFLPTLATGARIAELASGHGGWGLWALTATEGTHLDAFDISPAAIEMASDLAGGAGLRSRTSYTLQNALLIDTHVVEPWDACICSFLIEHLEQPDRLLAIIADMLRPHGTAFLTGALTAAQVDHIFEFRQESELVLLAERHGLRVLEMRSAGPRRTLANARFLPRSAALILQKRTNDCW